MKFDYLKFPSSVDPTIPYVSRPLIPIRLLAKGTHIETYALVDSGADRSVFNSRFANELLIELEDGKKEFYFGIGTQPVAVYRHKIKMQILGSREAIEVEVGFTDARGVDAILGEADFFEHYHMKFERNKDRLEIKPAVT